jgi:hypothetical protein
MGSFRPHFTHPPQQQSQLDLQLSEQTWGSVQLLYNAAVAEVGSFYVTWAAPVSHQDHLQSLLA